jgi:hypothetical protein
MLHSYSPLCLPVWLLLLAAGDVEEAAAQVSQLVASSELRARVGAAGREEVSLWDWRAATQHLLNYQYPLAMAAAAQYYGRTMGKAAQAAGYEGGAGGSAATGRLGVRCSPAGSRTPIVGPQLDLETQRNAYTLTYSTSPSHPHHPLM